MAEDQENKEDKFDAFTDAFTTDGEAIDYISLEQARVLAIRYARDNTEFYGAKYSQITLVWEFFEHDREDGEDYYDIRLSFRPSGRFRGEPGIEQFIIDKTGNIEIRQMLDEPTALDLPEPPGVTPAAGPPVTTPPPAAPPRPPTSSPPAETPPTPTQPRPTAAPTTPPRPQAPAQPPREGGVRPTPAARPRRGPPFKRLALIGLALAVLGVIAVGAIIFAARSGEEPVVERERVTRDRPRRFTATPVVDPTAFPTIPAAVAEPVVAEKEAISEESRVVMGEKEVAPQGPPHKFIGAVTIDGAPAPDGTEVSAWVEGIDGPPAKVTVSGGRYDINVVQRGSVSYANKKVAFKIGASDTEQSAIWKTGGADELDLVAGEGGTSSDDDRPPGIFEPRDEPPGFIEITTEGNNLKFDHSSLSAKAGTEITVRFHNSATALQHNWVLVKNGTKDKVAQAGLTAGSSNAWIPPGDARVIAHTGLLDPGTTEELRFLAPAVGAYQFVCTFPGHNFSMFGDFRVTR